MADLHVLPGVARPDLVEDQLAATADIIDLNVVTKLDLPPEKVLNKALAAGLTEVVVIGLDPSGNFWFASSKADGGDVLWHLEIAKKRLLDLMDVNSDGHPLDPPQKA